MTDTKRAQTPSSHLDHSLTWLDVSASYGRERAQLLAVDDMTRNARIAEANNQQAQALKLAEIHAQLAVAEELRALRLQTALPGSPALYGMRP